MKHPNGYGTVVKLSGNRRNPWAVRKTIRWNEKGHPVFLNIGYAPTKQDGLIMLAEYNKNPWDVDASKTTLQQLFDLWLEKKAPKLSEANRSALKSAYRYCKPLSGMQYSKIKSFHMQDTIDNCGRGYSTQAVIKNLWCHLDSFAYELDVIRKRNSDVLTSAPVPQTTKTVFTEDELQHVWDNQGVEFADFVLFLLYTGFRVSEAMQLKLTDIDTEEWTAKGGVKTTAGKNRIVPIHSRIIPIVENRMHHSADGYLFEIDGKGMNERRMRTRWNEVMDRLGMNHTPHECRHTLRSRLDSAGANKVCIDRIMGHKSQGTGESVYTHKSVAELRRNIELIT